MKKKHLIVLVDGTWIAAHEVRADSLHSNIYRLNLQLQPADKDGNPQIILYTRGIGSTGKLKKYVAGGFADGIDDIIADIYLNLCSNYVDNDKIYLFGFSRGAVVVRALSGLIGRVGLLKPDAIELYDIAWSSYVYGPSEQGRDALEENCRRDIEIEFMGLFDTVFGGNQSSSNRFHRLRFHDLDLEACVKHAVHLIAIDEQRSMFTNMPIEKRAISSPSKIGRTLEQIWMPGVHSDVGGTYERNFLGNVAFVTMVDKIMSYTDLLFYDWRIDQIYGNLVADFNQSRAYINNELVGLWRFAKTNRKADPSHEGQYMHPIVYFLNTKQVFYKKNAHRSDYVIDKSFNQIKKFSSLRKYKFKREEFNFL